MEISSLSTQRSFSELLEKYNVPAPRYTSYPTVPYWNNEAFTKEGWISSVQKIYKTGQGISVYIHLPYCESLCTYCGCNTRITKNHTVETPYISALIKEWEFYVEQLGEKPTISELHLGGGTPTFFQPENLEYLIQKIFESAHRAEALDMSLEVHPANTKKEHLEVLANLGFNRISIGVQDFDNHILKTINRKQTFEQVVQCTAWARELNYQSINYDLVYGLPFQTQKHIEENINKLRQLQPDRIAYYSYAHVPWVRPGQRAYSEKDLPQGEQKQALYALGRRLLAEAGYEEVGMDHFSLPHDSLTKAKHNKTLHRNFMGYTDKHTELMIGLGASSISDAWLGFAQNEKQVEKYMKSVLNQGTAVVKGHFLSEEDLRVRSHILNVMCQLETVWHTEDSLFLNRIFERLTPLEEDGLVELYEDRLKVTATGIPFIRNISMALDEQLWKNQPETIIFSQSV